MGDNEKEEIAGRLGEVATALYDGNRSELARALGMQPPSFYKYLQGARRPGTSVLLRVTRLGVNLHWLLTGEGKMLRSTSDRLSPVPLAHQMTPIEIEGPDGMLHRIPLLQIASGEDGCPRLEEVGESGWLSESLIRRMYGVAPNRLKGFRISGDAMIDTIRPGERVRGVLWDGGSVVDGAVYLLYRSHGVIVRRVRYNGDDVLLEADNPKVSDLTHEVDSWLSRFRPIAQVLEVTRSL